MVKAATRSVFTVFHVQTVQSRQNSELKLLQKLVGVYGTAPDIVRHQAVSRFGPSALNNDQGPL